VVARWFDRQSLSAETFLEAFDALLVVFFLGDPEFLFVSHDVGQVSASQEDHVLPSRGVLDPELELATLVALEQFRFALEDAFDIELFEVLFEARGETGIHTASS